MKGRRVVLLALTAVLVFGSVIPAMAGQVRNDKVEISAILSNLCTNEIMDVTVRGHILEVEDEDGNVRQIFSVHGTGVGLTTGVEYIFNQQTRFENPDCPGMRVSEVRAISKGDTVNEVLEVVQECLPDGTLVTLETNFKCPGENGNNQP